MSTDTTNTDTQTQGEPDLGEAGRKAIQAERDRAKAAERRVAELERSILGFESQIAELTQTAETLTTERNTLTVENRRLNVGIDKGLPKRLIDRLRGDDEESLAADADDLLQFVPADSKPAAPRPDPSQGTQKAGKPSNAQLFADQLDGIL